MAYVVPAAHVVAPVGAVGGGVVGGGVGGGVVGGGVVVPPPMLRSTQD